MSSPEVIDAFEQFQKVLHENLQNIELPKSDFLKTCYKLMKAFTKQVEFPKPLELINCTMQYIHYLHNYCDNCDIHKLKWYSLHQLFQCISEAFSSRHMKDEFVHVASQQVLDLALAPSIRTWHKKKLLNTYNAIVKGSTKAVRAKTLATIGNMYLCKLFDLLDVCGDYEHQAVVLETILRMYDEPNLKLKEVEELIPHSEKLRKAFMSIDIWAFKEDARKFLNEYNVNNSKIFSVLCTWIRLDEVIVKQSTHTASTENIWMDFDLVDQTLSWCCHKNFMCQDIFQTNHCETVHVSAHSVQEVKISRFGPNRQCLIVTLILNCPCVPLNETAQLVLKDVKALKFCVLNSQTINQLILEVFPILFGKKYTKTTLRHRKVYKEKPFCATSRIISISNSISSYKRYSDSPREVSVGVEARSNESTKTICLSNAGGHKGSLAPSHISISSSDSTSSCKPYSRTLREVPIGIEAKSSEKTETICLSYAGSHKGKLPDNIYKPHELPAISYCNRGSVADTVLDETVVHIVPEIPSVVKSYTKNEAHIPLSYPRIEIASTVIYNKELFLGKGMKGTTKQQLAEETENKIGHLKDTIKQQAEETGNKIGHIQHESKEREINDGLSRHRNTKNDFQKLITKATPSKKVTKRTSKAKQQQDRPEQKKMIRMAINKMQRDFERVHGKSVKNDKPPLTFHQALERFQKNAKLSEAIHKFQRSKKVNNKIREQSEFRIEETINYEGNSRKNRFKFQWEDILELLKKDGNTESGKEATHKRNQKLIKTSNISKKTSRQMERQRNHDTGQKRNKPNNFEVKPSKRQCHNPPVKPIEKVKIISNIQLDTGH